MEISDAILKRKSFRAYTDQPVSGGDLEKIIEAGRWAPNAGPFQISVIRNPGLLKKINDKTRDAMVNSDREFLQQRAALPGYQPIYGAPVLILLSGPADVPNTPINAALAAENMVLQATGLGLASCFIITPSLALNAPDNSALAGQAGIPTGNKVVCAVLVGHPAAENKFSAAERLKKGAVNYVD